MSTRHAIRMLSACWFTQTKSMVTPKVMPAFASYIAVPFGNLKNRSQLVIASTTFLALALLCEYVSGFQSGEWISESVNTMVGSKRMGLGGFLSAVYIGLKPKQVFG